MWLAGIANQAGAPFVHCSIEESFDTFLKRTLLGAGVPELIYSLNAMPKFPHNTDDIIELLMALPPGILWLDHVVSTFSHIPGENLADRDRRCLDPLASICKVTGWTVVACFHENRAGEYSGSAGMVNVARCVHNLKRVKGAASVLSCAYTNGRDVAYDLRFIAQEVPYLDPQTGAPQMERLDDGSLASELHRVIVAVEHTTVSSKDVAAPPGTPRPAKADHEKRLME